VSTSNGACAARADGTLWCWGYNNYGELGAGIALGATSATPIQVSGLTGVTLLASGRYQICALGSVGGNASLYCWGSNTAGQLGDGTTNSSSPPVSTYPSTDVKQVAIGGSSTYDQAHLIVQLTDPATLISKVELRIAEAGKTSRPSFDLTAAPATRFELPAQLRGRSYEYTLRALDRYGNVLAERGSDPDPELVRGGSTATAQHGR